MASLAFGILALLTIASALAVVFLPRTFQSAVWLMVCLITIAGHFLLMGSELVAVLQIIVYAGAVVVLFVFVIQLLNMDPQETPVRLHARRREWAVRVAVVFALVVGLFALLRGAPAASHAGPPVLDFEHIRQLCALFLSQHLLAFELTSVLLLAGIIGAVLLAKKEYLKR
ncbi:NADH-quinone oxidoreductase subunit J [bacterium]|nr:NADH-quinone oxidoreductase subunit J [bacterium]